MELVKKFQEYIVKEGLFSPRDRLLLAVSGGLDSVVLCELCVRLNYDLVIAHCNFGLRGEESERDERFVRDLAAGYGRDVLVGEFDTLDYVAEHKVSVQVAARELRYMWFKTLVDEGVAKYVVTAHQLDDNIETLLMNFFKGTGIAGLKAMVPGQGVVVRPLLFATREEIRGYAEERGLAWVEDSSNESDKYTRNYFRHQVIPMIAQAYPGVMANLAGNIDRFREIGAIYRVAVDQEKNKLLEYRGNEVHIPVRKLLQTPGVVTILYEIISAYGFSPQQAEACRELLESPSGRYLVSGTYRILKNRNWLIITPLETTVATNVLVEAGEKTVTFGGGVLRVQREAFDPSGPGQGQLASGDAGFGAVSLDQGLATVPLDAGFNAVSLDQGPRVALLDAAQIRFPLLLRPWKAGDYFYPLGMRKKKKLARFFIDKKLSVADKEKVWVLEMDKKIIWVVGLRIDDRWRVGPGTREVLRIEWVG